MGSALRALGRLPFVVGMARSLDLFGAFNEPHPYEGHRNGAEADAAALRSDWEAIGGDMNAATKQITQEAGRR